MVGRDVPQAGSRGLLMSIRTGYSGSRGGVPFPHASQRRSLLSQCPTWGCTRGGGRLLLAVAGMAPRRPSITT
jgi:hypothetical protein